MTIDRYTQQDGSEVRLMFVPAAKITTPTAPMLADPTMFYCADDDPTFKLYKSNGTALQLLSAGDALVGNTLDATAVSITNLPTTDPQVAGRMWNDGGTIKLSIVTVAGAGSAGGVSTTSAVGLDAQ